MVTETSDKNSPFYCLFEDREKTKRRIPISSVSCSVYFFSASSLRPQVFNVAGTWRHFALNNSRNSHIGNEDSCGRLKQKKTDVFYSEGIVWARWHAGSILKWQNENSSKTPDKKWKSWKRNGTAKWKPWMKDETRNGQKTKSFVFAGIRAQIRTHFNCLHTNSRYHSWQIISEMWYI